MIKGNKITTSGNFQPLGPLFPELEFSTYSKLPVHAFLARSIQLQTFSSKHPVFSLRSEEIRISPLVCVYPNIGSTSASASASASRYEHLDMSTHTTQHNTIPYNTAQISTGQNSCSHTIMLACHHLLISSKPQTPTSSPKPQQQQASITSFPPGSLVGGGYYFF